ncbi:oligoendopeptidase F [Sunxiuqinia elliptica]|uniref:Oligopeptidase F n=1 Tax=Sunxiuqinia elliptica TaxID=655355 RepID=A0A4R6H7Z5_9BACT|nr:oligoendopeptidase F [Sunxiuqinia elliptica]TDO03701.1 oligoendopeptidase F [Sunxiuqinia elliptica]TDO61982.1 oligoendopeptidase F [Sunxiuqinia elliptica]
MKRINLKLNVILLTILAMFAAMNSYSQQTREEIPAKYKWNLTDLYASDEAWRDAVESLTLKLDEVEQFKGTLTKSATNLLKALEFNSELSKEASKIYLYAGMSSDLDTRDMKYNGMKQELQSLFSNFGAKAAFIQPEILAADWETIDGFLKEEPKLEIYRMGLENMFRTKAHTLSEAEERIMALSGMVSSVPQAVYGTFSNAEMPKPEVTLSDGSKIAIGSAEYGRYRASSNRADRETVFNAYWNNFAKFKASYGEMLYGNVKSDIFNARARHYESSLEASLYPNNIPVEVYHSLVDNVNENLPAFHRYLKIKQRMMGVDTLKYLDLYAPVVKDVDLKYSYDEATTLILEALKPLGKEYVSTVEKAVDERWIDVYPTPGKRSGAYSNGAFYDGHPFILLNYNDLYDDVSTLAHELGHTMQSYFSNKTQPYPTADYETFVAEVASTFNEVLLFNYMIDRVEDDDVKLSILMEWLDRFKGTLFRQTQFAEFELKIHEEAEKGKPLTGDEFSEIYADIVNRYYGHKEGVCHVDDYMHMEWAYIPHFYYNFYVYQYSTSFTASISLAEKVMSGDKQALDSYIEFLSAGGSDYPIELLKSAGVDMTSTEPFEKTIASMNKVMDEIEKILDKKEKE